MESNNELSNISIVGKQRSGEKMCGRREALKDGAMIHVGSITSRINSEHITLIFLC